MEKEKVCYICERKFSTDKKTVKSEIIVISQENLEELLLIIAI